MTGSVGLAPRPLKWLLWAVLVALSAWYLYDNVLYAFFRDRSGETLWRTLSRLAHLLVAVPLLLMVLVLVLLFNNLRQPLAIMLTVPLAVIGVSVGLLLANEPFGFMALLGFLSLSGMLIKNAIVLVDQIDVEIREGKARYQAVLDAAASRARPVFLGAATTVLGVAPLLVDPFFRSMAVTIMFGLIFATGLTLVVVPLLYSVVFRIRVSEQKVEA